MTHACPNYDKHVTENDESRQIDRRTEENSSWMNKITNK